MKRRKLTTAQRVQLFLDHKRTCHVCGGQIDGAREAWEVEHIIPLALGGDDELSNMAPVHKKGCHEQKTRTEDVPAIARAKRREARHLGVKKPSGRWAYGRDSDKKAKIGGGWEYR